MVRKIPDLSADAFILDLEDSILPEHKEQALECAASFLKSDVMKKIYVRLDSTRLSEEMTALKNCVFEGYMIPKFEDPADYEEYTDAFSARRVIALIETPKGFVNLEKTASCAWVDGLAFGAEDYTAAVGMENRPEYLTGLRARIVMYGKAFGKEVYDTPSFSMNDPVVLEQDIRTAKEMGFDGKLAIHPNHISEIDRIFRTVDPEYMRSVIDQYEAAKEAVVVIDGAVYEKMHIEHLKRILMEQNH